MKGPMGTVLDPGPHQCPVIALGRLHTQPEPCCLGAEGSDTCVPAVNTALRGHECP